MPIGQNVPLGDKLIKKTTIQPDTTVPAKSTAVSPRVSSPVQPSFRPARNVATSNTVKMTFYVKQDKNRIRPYQLSASGVRPVFSLLYHTPASRTIKQPSFPD